MRRFLAILLLSGGLAFGARAAMAQPLDGAIPRSGVLDFEIWRDGSRIGSHILSFKHDGNRLTVDIDVKLTVEIATITVFRYAHRNRETWDGDRLVAMESATDDDGTPNRVVVDAVPEGLDIAGTKFTGDVPGDLLPTTYWRRDTIEHTRLISSQDGRIFQVSVTPMGTETVPVADHAVTAQHYAMRGDLDLDLWYDRAGEWVKLSFAAWDGSVIEYRRVTPPGDQVAHAQ